MKKNRKNNFVMKKAVISDMKIHINAKVSYLRKRNIASQISIEIWQWTKCKF